MYAGQFNRRLGATPFLLSSRRIPATQAQSRPNFEPARISQIKGTWKVELDLPGIDLEDIDITVEDGSLTVTARRQEPTVEEGTRVVLNERPKQNLQRSFRLDETIDPETIDAVLGDGVLTLTLKSREVPSARRITVRQVPSAPDSESN
jgi:HSP20 family protein